MGDLNLQANPLQAHDLKLRVYVEGDSDRFLLQHRWVECDKADYSVSFKRAPADYHAPDDNDERGGGCKQVVRAVTLGQHFVDGEIVFGLLDRDALVSVRSTRGQQPFEERLGIFLEADDELFDTALHFHERVKCLRLCEIENYLVVQPSAVDRVLASLPKDGPRPHAPDEMTRTLLTLAERALPLMATLLYRRQHRSPSNRAFKKSGFGCKVQSAEEMRAAIAKVLPEWDEIEPAVRRNEATLEALCGADDHEERWGEWCRFIDGKWLLEALIVGHRIQKADALGDLLADRVGCPAEVEQIVDEFASKAKLMVAT